MPKQKQHYVPRFILRQFLFDAEKEQVAVYDKHDDKDFVTSIMNIMAERGFHDFSMDDRELSFEPIASKIEEQVLPAYQRLIETRKLNKTGEEQAALDYLIAFQFVRTKAHRHLYDDVEEAVRVRMRKMQGDIKGEEGREPSEDDKKRNNLQQMLSTIDHLTPLVTQKDLVLIEVGDDRGFYLGDHPVGLHNNREFGPYGNLGFAVPGIEIYLPLSSEFLLAAWCPSILKDINKVQKETIEKCERDALAEVLCGRVTAAEMKSYLDSVRLQFAGADKTLKAFNEGTPLNSSAENMDYYNSIQGRLAFRYLIDKHGNFDVARRYNKEFPKFRTGHRPTVM